MIKEIRDKIDKIDLTEDIVFNVNCNYPIYKHRSQENIDKINDVIHKINKASVRYLRENHTSFPNLLYMSMNIFLMLYSCGYIALTFGDDEVVGVLAGRYKIYVDTQINETIIVLAVDYDSKIEAIKKFNFITDIN
jgi:hypothetical protein